MKVYTKGGDKGRTSLIGGERVPKDDPRVEAYGTVDELSALIALLRDKMGADDLRDKLSEDDLRADLLRVLSELMSVEAALAGGNPMPEGAEGWLEERIDILNADLPPVERFTLPGGHELVSLAHVCRTVCRRAERRAVSAQRHPEPADRQAWDLRAQRAQKYLNRLSDYLYIVSRTLTKRLNLNEIYWEA